ncbi:tetratricopeptide repeat protein [Marinitoga aeolica]|uniref:Tetratricopeptide repeat protein n=1 Tax=Marinitoga aeolica TaxID=2809031 RepID=A0ABY8PP85_9BACT|nr:hypothetical protein [Marinitoga aeolica]WGS64437.1 hypothetical protein JRV97_08650 [Marinitoga aeolica]
MDSSLLKKIFLILFLLSILSLYSQTFLDKAEVYYFNGKSAFQTGEYKSAERFFEEALKLSAEIEIKYPDIRYMLGWTKFYLKKYKEAKNYLKDYASDPKVALALKSIEEGNIQENLHFESLKIKSSLPATEATTNNNLKIGWFYYILVSFVIFFVVAVMAFLIYFFILKKYSFGKKVTEVKTIEEPLELEEVEEEASIPVEEILEVKIDELEELWNEYEKMKKKMDIDESEPIEPINVPNNQSVETVETNLEELDVNSLLEESLPEENKDINIDIEDVLEEENVIPENTEEHSEIETKNANESEIEEEIKNENDNIESFIENEKMDNLDNIETIKPNIDVITKYNKIMSEPEGAIIVSNVKGLESLEKIDEEVAKKGGIFSKADLHAIFKEIFADKNRDHLMIE